MATYSDPLGYYGKCIIEKYHNDILLGFPSPQRPPPGVPSTFSLRKQDWGLSDRGLVLIPCPPSSGPTVGIVGAGVCGLYAGMMLQSVDVSYEILEASSRVGGRIYTKEFSKAKYDYYDVGAMRFPNTPTMKRTFHLFTTLRLPLLKYIFKNDQALLLYNGVLRQQAHTTENPAAWNVENIPGQYAQYGYTALLDNVIEPFAEGIVDDFKRNIKAGWDKLMLYDRYSTRAYMSGIRSDTKPDLDKLGLMPYPTDVVRWIETFTNPTGFFDRALSEMVLKAVALKFRESGNVEWYCIDGGSQVIVEQMVRQLRHAPVTNARVNAISYDAGQPAPVNVRLANGDKKTYSHVISTVSLPVLRVIDLTKALCDSVQATAFHTPRYGSGTKIGVKFKTAWWSDNSVVKTGGIVGGQSFTDRMVCAVVYPSYGTTGNAKTTVLIVSYCWTDDAARWGALFGGSSESKDLLKDIVVRDLVALHGLDESQGYRFLMNQWVDHHTYSWDNDPNTIGAFAFFGPGDFVEVYTNLTRPAAEGHLHFASEALSARHAWLVGALDASWRAVYEILLSSFPEKVDDFKRKWGSNDDWTEISIKKQVVYSIALQRDAARRA